jgi:hypothetical protein
LPRITDIERWRKQLEKTLDEVNSEIGVLSEAKESCERALVLMDTFTFTFALTYVTFIIHLE